MKRSSAIPYSFQLISRLFVQVDPEDGEDGTRCVEYRELSHYRVFWACVPLGNVIFDQNKEFASKVEHVRN